MSLPLNWNSLTKKTELDRIIEDSKVQPALVFKHRTTSAESIHMKEMLEQQWNIPSDQLTCYLVDVMKDKEVAYEASEISGVSNEFPQVLLFADGVTMYDESHEMINVKKIKLALKIINRTFRWMETRV